MSVLEAIFLGILQGVTEFLPVSSSGHLTIAQYLMKNFEQPGMLYDVLLHCATLLAVLIFFRKRVGLLIKAFFGIFIKRYSVYYFENRRFLWGIVIASAPTAIIGLCLEKYVMEYFQTPAPVGYALILTSFILITSDRFRGNGRITPGKSLIVGIVQGIAVIPGISRSGSTIAAGLMLGIKRDEMAEFSFLMSVPAILGAALLQLRHAESVPVSDIAAYGAGMAAAFISGMAAIGFMMYFVRSAQLKYFAIYCLAAGIISVVFL